MSAIAMEPVDQLARRGAMAVGWGVLVSGFKVVATIGVQATLARLLGPEEFGLFALSMLVVGVATYFADVGLATSLVQSDRVTDDDIRFVLTMNLAISGAVTGLVVIAAPWLAQLFGKPEATGIIQLLAPAFVLNGMAAVSVSMLRRSLDYRTIQLAGLVGYLVGFAMVGIALAWVMGSAYALACAFSTQALVTLMLLYAKVHHPLNLGFGGVGRRAHLSFGGTVLVTNLINWVVTSIDRIVIGRLFSSAQLGLYSAAYNLVHAPVGLLYPNLQSVVFSSTARMKGQIESLRSAYLDLLHVVAVLAFPTFTGVYLLAQPLMLTIYGPAWESAVAFAATFSVMAPFLMVWAISTPMLWNTGRKSVESMVQLPFVAVAVLAMVAASSHSVQAVAWVATSLFAARTVLMVALVARAVSIRWSQIASRLWPACVAMVAVAIAVSVVDGALCNAQVAQSLRLVVGLGITGATLLFVLLARPAFLPATLRRLLAHMAATSFPLARPILKRLAGGSDL